jgi:hypothetical protein
VIVDSHSLQLMARSSWHAQSFTYDLVALAVKKEVSS